MAGRSDAALEAARTSEARFVAKGNTASAGRARVLAERILAGAGAS